ncbi:hypothetical protein GECvBGOT_gp209c [Salmonella phage GEC_vB_GOT]|nr:hypothetical protein GECvBGOT_gp209c [Salmonella phage GEC_vB_GOT]
MAIVRAPTPPPIIAIFLGLSDILHSIKKRIEQ